MGQREVPYLLFFALNGMLCSFTSLCCRLNGCSRANTQGSYLPVKLLRKLHNICVSLKICIASHDQSIVHVCMITHPFIQTRPVYLYAHNFWILPCSGASATKGGETYRRISP